MGPPCKDIPADVILTPTVFRFKEEEEGLFRDTKPTNFIFKVEGFSMYAKTSFQFCESNSFMAGGYKWKLSIYPHGNHTDGGTGHVSLYLVMADADSLPAGWQVDVNFTFFLLDQQQNEYLILGDLGGRTRRFDKDKTEWGFSKLVSLENLNSCSRKYLVNDTCTFGAEVMVCKSTGDGDCLSMVKEPITVYTEPWIVPNFSQITKDSIDSKEFSAGGYRWHLKIYPIGDATAKEKAEKKEQNPCVSIFLCLADSNTQLPPESGKRLAVKMTLRIKNQVNGNHVSFTCDCWFPTGGDGWGWPHFLDLSTLHDQTKGYVLNDTCIAEGEVTVLGLLHRLP